VSRALVRGARALLYRGNRFACPVCGGRFRRFASAGRPRRRNAKCPGCGSRERDRFTVLFLRERERDLRAPGALRILHVAPERAVAGVLRSWEGVDYLSGDLRPGRAMVVLDVTRIDHPEASFDGTWCSHVLEHVPDDRGAMAELHRVLAPGGWAVVLVPIVARSTFEDPSVRSAEERRRLFGQHDHVRSYGPDIADRLADAGFTVDVVRPSDVAAAGERRRHLLPADDQPLFFCRKAGHAS
jgi:SAM-dependent methyltransferase